MVNIFIWYLKCMLIKWFFSFLENLRVLKKSGQVYEKRLIVKYIADFGKDPITGEDITEDDLLEIKASKFPIIFLDGLDIMMTRKKKFN